MIAAYGVLTVTGLVAGLLAGHVMFRSDYCLVGMLRDLFLFRSATMLRFLLLQTLISLAVLELARLAGALPYYPAVMMGPPNLSSVFGGCLFGFGMVLAGSCVIGCLYKAGAGHVLSLCTLLAMVAGATLFAEFAPLWHRLMEPLRLASAVTVPQSLGCAAGWLVWPLVGSLSWVVVCWAQQGKLQLAAVAQGFVQPWKTAIILALITLAMCLTTGGPLGVTTCYVKLGAWLESMVVPNYVATNPYFNTVAVSYIPPLGGTLIQGRLGPGLDAIVALQLSVIGGVMAGAFISARRVGEFRWHVRVPLRQWFLAAGGGLLVGFAARMSPGCNVWHVMGGVPLLVWNSWLFVAGLLPGVWLGSKVIKARL